MPFQVIYKPLAQLEAAEANEWYSQAHIGMTPGPQRMHNVHTSATVPA